MEKSFKKRAGRLSTICHAKTRSPRRKAKGVMGCASLHPSCRPMGLFMIWGAPRGHEMLWWILFIFRGFAASRAKWPGSHRRSLQYVSRADAETRRKAKGVMGCASLHPSYGPTGLFMVWGVPRGHEMLWLILFPLRGFAASRAKCSGSHRRSLQYMITRRRREKQRVGKMLDFPPPGRKEPIHIMFLRPGAEVRSRYHLPAGPGQIFGRRLERKFRV